MRKYLSLLMLMALCACQRYPAPKNNDQAVPLPDNQPDQEITEFRVTETKRGRKKYEATAAYAAIFKQTNQVVATAIHVNFFDGNGDIFTTLTADSGFINETTKDMRAMGRVVVVTQDSTRLESEELAWDHRAEKIRSDKFVKITRGRDVLSGIGLETDPELNQIEIKKNIKATVRDVDESNF